jgi:transcriptional regulator with XRE-family HTH domain
VASLARISTEWYTRLEQGRNARASKEALRRVAQALRLSPAEVSHLLRLSGYPGESPGNGTPMERESIPPQIQRFLDQQMPCPAYVTGVRWDILAWNRSAEILWGDIGSMDGLRRNCLYHLFLGERYPRILKDWEKHARNFVAVLRDQGTTNLEDPWFRELIDTLMEHSPRFSQLWESRDIVPYLDGRKDYEVPELGRLSFNYMALEAADSASNGLRLMVFMPLPGTGTEELLREAVGAGR